MGGRLPGAGKDREPLPFARYPQPQGANGETRQRRDADPEHHRPKDKEPGVDHHSPRVEGEPETERARTIF